MYKALKRLWLTSERRYAEPGEQVDLSHLTEEQILRLEVKGAVASLARSHSERKSAKKAPKNDESGLEMPSTSEIEVKDDTDR
jgi:hypothetical protein